MKHGAPRRKEISRFGRGLITALWTLGILLALLAGGAAYAGWRVSERDRTLPNQWLDGIAVGDLTQEEAASRLREAGWDSLNDLPLTVNFPLDLSLQLDRREARASYTAEEAAALIYSRGHGASRFENLRDSIQASLSRGVELRLEPGALNETYVRANIRSVTDRFRELTWDSELHLDAANARMSLTKGGGSIWLDDAKIYRAVSEALRENTQQLDWTEISGEVNPPDFQKIREDIGSEPQDARFSGDHFEIIPETVGCSFDAEEALRLWNEALPGMRVEIPVVYTPAAVTAADLEALLYRDRLCFMTTYYRDSTDERKSNIHLAADRLNGRIVYPGEVFSYNDAIGERTEEEGFLLAGAYADGEQVEEIGGGICQVSSTLYCASMYAQMKTTMRQNHWFAVNYLSMGYDATVSWKMPDFRFRNDREYPVRIDAYYDDESVTIEFWGTDTDGTHVKPFTSVSEVYDEEYKNVLVGYSVTVTRNILDANDNIIRQVTEPTGIYHLHDHEIKWPEEKRMRDAAQAVLGLG